MAHLILKNDYHNVISYLKPHENVLGDFWVY